LSSFFARFEDKTSLAGGS